ncbi:ferredoxin reductase [Solimonas marina]|uniref:Ferredoxin reductase n=1 Tax=Solimonas marina TaxID=2714601 RepID=A0A969WDU4_9GAMM|nr:ferredoxin reductase [Solimonas marina]NKF24734.1 ferredoxin reductase [Solimonas marina]
MTTALPIRLRDRALRSAWLHPFNDADAINDLLGSLNPRWSLTEVRAELVAREPQTADTVRLVLRPNRLWTGFVAGQHVTITVEIDGVRHQRVYSLSSDPADRRLLSITVKRQPQGRVSNWLHDHLHCGDVVTLSPAQGDFVLPQNHGPVLLLSAGSGITPMRALLYALRARGAGDVVLLHVCRDADDQIFASELAALASGWPGLRFVAWHTADRGRPALAELLATVPDHIERDTWLCGPAAFMADVEAHWQASGATERLRLERFGLAPTVIGSGDAAEVRCSRSERLFAAESGEALLPAAERAGLKPAYGCRIGVCRTCLCKKRSGTVQNLVTGERSSEPNEWIRLCVSSAQSEIELDL